MCDTIVALGNSTADGSVILAKNSDRQPKEGQKIAVIPRRSGCQRRLTRASNQL